MEHRPVVIRLTFALSRAAQHQDSTAPQGPTGRRELAKGVGSSAMFGGRHSYAVLENSRRYWARPARLPETSGFSTVTMNASAGTSHSQVRP